MSHEPARGRDGKGTASWGGARSGGAPPGRPDGAAIAKDHNGGRNTERLLRCPRRRHSTHRPGTCRSPSTARSVSARSGPGGTDGTIDWYCCPSSDSPSVFAAVLDADLGGAFQLSAAVGAGTKQFYFPDTNVLITRFFTEDGLGKIQDFMPVTHAGESGRHRLIRRVVCARGTIPFRARGGSRFGYGARPHILRILEGAALFRSDALTLTPCPVSPMTPTQRTGGGASAAAGNVRPVRRPARTPAAPAESPSTPGTRTSGRHAGSTHRTPLLHGRTLPATALVFMSQYQFRVYTLRTPRRSPPTRPSGPDTHRYSPLR
ncbi:trehalase-like domain-containing protein [Streptomyces sp. NPDC059582]|uniref:trehalase-like domain-containing protein n=1 Tax=Streptomyces sp. NPDC059582 TaxID=3346875 RepID=UPI0036B62426